MPRRTDEWRRKKVSRVGVSIWEWLGVWQTYRIDVHFSGRLGGRANSDIKYRAEVTSQPPYRRISMTFDRKFVDTAKESELAASILHETIHPLVFEGFDEECASLDKAGRQRHVDAEEHAVDLIQRWIVRARSGE